MKTNIKVSIVIPNFNKGEWISETLESILDQSYSRIEVVIVDDGSTDNSLEVIGRFCNRYENFKLIERERKPKGGSTCRNIGLEVSKGDYILFLDSDDLITPECIENRVLYIVNNKVDFAVFNTGTFYKVIGDSSLRWIVPKGNHLEMFLSHDLPWNISSVLWKKVALDSLNGFNEDFVRLQDVELHTRALIAKLNYKVAENKAQDFYYRINPNRYLDDQEILLINKLKGINKYISYFENNLIENRKYLKGTAISVYKDVLYFYNGKTIDNRIINTILARNFKSNTKLENLVLAIYRRMFSLGFSKIKGFNFLFKKAFIYI
jgi:glycosyltransferase involved in cell wall biosynthesis